MTDHEYAKIMHDAGVADGKAHIPPRYATEPEYSIGYAEGEAQ